MRAFLALFHLALAFASLTALPGLCALSLSRTNCGILFRGGDLRKLSSSLSTLPPSPSSSTATAAHTEKNETNKKKKKKKRKEKKKSGTNIEIADHSASMDGPTVTRRSPIASTEVLLSSPPVLTSLSSYLQTSFRIFLSSLVRILRRVYSFFGRSSPSPVRTSPPSFSSVLSSLSVLAAEPSSPEQSLQIATIRPRLAVRQGIHVGDLSAMLKHARERQANVLVLEYEEGKSGRRGSKQGGASKTKEEENDRRVAKAFLELGAMLEEERCKPDSSIGGEPTTGSHPTTSPPLLLYASLSSPPSPTFSSHPLSQLLSSPSSSTLLDPLTNARRRDNQASSLSLLSPLTLPWHLLERQSSTSASQSLESLSGIALLSSLPNPPLSRPSLLARHTLSPAPSSGQSIRGWLRIIEPRCRISAAVMRADDEEREALKQQKRALVKADFEDERKVQLMKNKEMIEKQVLERRERFREELARVDDELKEESSGIVTIFAWLDVALGVPKERLVIETSDGNKCSCEDEGTKTMHELLGRKEGRVKIFVTVNYPS